MRAAAKRVITRSRKHEDRLCRTTTASMRFLCCGTEWHSETGGLSQAVVAVSRDDGMYDAGNSTPTTEGVRIVSNASDPNSTSAGKKAL